MKEIQLENTHKIQAFDSLCTHAVYQSSPAPTDDFGPDHGSYYDSATSMEKVRIGDLYQRYMIQVIDAFRDFFLQNTRHTLDLNLLNLTDDDKIDLLREFRVTVQAERFTKFLYAHHRGGDYDVLAVTGFSPGIALMHLREPVKLQTKLLDFFRRMFEAGEISENVFLDAFSEEKCVWCFVWGKTILAYLDPESRGLIEAYWGEIQVPAVA